MTPTIGSCKKAAMGFAFAIGLAFGGGSAVAETCGGAYRVQQGETLSGIADKLYKNAGLWTAIQSGNTDKIGVDPDNIRAGMLLRLSCIDGLPVGLERSTPKAVALTRDATPRAQPAVAKRPAPAVTLASATRQDKISLLTGNDYAPFSDADLPGGGLAFAVVEAAMQAANPAQGFGIHRVDGWQNHLDPLLSNALLDMGFPWIVPDCGLYPDAPRCAEFAASDPMFEMLMLLFVNRDAPVAYAQETDMHGKRLCRPAGYAMHELDRPDRRWLSEALITLEQPRSVAECFLMLGAGEVDGVVMNEFTGRTAIKALGLKDAIDVAPRPLGIVGLHVLAHRSHPEGEALLALFNEGLRRIKADGSYQAIMDAHMTRVWAEF